MDGYRQFLKSKEITDIPSGFSVPLSKLDVALFDWQKVIVRWALMRGRAALFETCGLGKTFQQLVWADWVNKRTKKPVLILAPLAVSEQTRREGDKFRIKANICQSKEDVVNGINITNYEKLHLFDTSVFSGIVLDESGCIKNFSGVRRNQIIEAFRNTPYRLACTATPAPNDFMELGNHAEFLGVMTRSEMLAMFFINDTANTGHWRLKGHVKDNIFWKWLSSWAVMITKPSDIGYDDDGFILPEISYHEHLIKSGCEPKRRLFVREAGDLNERRKVRKETVSLRCDAAAELVNGDNDKWVIWCGLNAEGDYLEKVIEGSVQVAGRHSEEYKIEKITKFAHGEISRMISKAKIIGLGMNLQICSNAAFVGLSDSFEQFYQAVRRIWRFGQLKPVDIHIFLEEREGSVLKNIKRKESQFKKMIDNMLVYMKDLTERELECSERDVTEYEPKEIMELPTWL